MSSYEERMLSAAIACFVVAILSVFIMIIINSGDPIKFPAPPRQRTPINGIDDPWIIPTPGNRFPTTIPGTSLTIIP